MNDILEIAIKAKITDGKNKIINDSLEKSPREDRVIKPITREIAELVIKLTECSNNKKC